MYMTDEDIAQQLEQRNTQTQESYECFEEYKCNINAYRTVISNMNYYTPGEKGELLTALANAINKDIHT